MKSLVTGGAGFIGNHLVNRLLEMGHEVVVLDNFRRGNKLDKKTIRSIELIQGDVRDRETVLRAAHKTDWIFHFAAVLGVDIVADNPVETMDTEVVGMSNVATAATLNGTERVIYASTSGVYGKSAIEEAVREDFAVSPKSSYAIAKRYNEIYLASLFEEKIFESVSLRFFNVYGPKQDRRMVIPRFFQQAIAGDPITVFGSGAQTRDFTYIDDVVEATMRLATQASGCGIYNISNEDEHTIKDLAEAIVKVTGSSSKISFINPPENRYDFEVERRFGSSQKLFDLTGFKPNTPLEKGLKIVYESCLAEGVPA
ncbi:MAG: NAD-dependent epimerase/dehydratase family protein [Ignavibacteria bacterium]|nr:NAD-dependent epimerase/dehydratase family protein [Ignavibacteria bacterium]